MNRAEILAEAVHLAWYARTIALGESPVRWSDAPAWRRSALEHTIGFWESWESTIPLHDNEMLDATQLAWIQYHQRNDWDYAELLMYGALPAEQQTKLRAMLDAYLLFRRQLSVEE